MKRWLVAAVAFVAVAAPSVPAFAIIGRPLTPMSYAGVARRTTRRAVYAGAAYGGAAYGAPAYYGGVTALPQGCAPGVPCGGVVYQPQYQGTTVIYVPHSAGSGRRVRSVTALAQAMSTRRKRSQAANTAR